MGEMEKVSRNDPCPCGSGKKYKKCCGQNVTIQNIPAPQDQETEAPGGAPAGFDPSQLNPEWMAQMQTAMKRLPKGQLFKLQKLIAKAMVGKDVSQDIAAFEKTLPTELQGLLKNAPIPEGAELPQTAEKKESKFSKLWKKFKV